MTFVRKWADTRSSSLDWPQMKVWVVKNPIFHFWRKLRAKMGQKLNISNFCQIILHLIRILMKITIECMIFNNMSKLTYLRVKNPKKGLFLTVFGPNHGDLRVCGRNPINQLQSTETSVLDQKIRKNKWCLLCKTGGQNRGSKYENF